MTASARRFSETLVLGLIEKIYDAALEPVGWPCFLDALSDALGGTSTSLLLQDLDSPTASVAMTTRSDPDEMRAYGEYYARLDPWARAAKAKGLVRPGVVLLGDSLVPYADVSRTEYFHDFARPRRVARILAGTVEVAGTLASVLTVPRAAEDSPFDEEDRTLMLLLMPHLRRAITIDRRVGVARSEQDDLDRLPTATLVLEPTGQVAFVNRAAETLLEKRDGLTITKGRLTAGSAKETRAIEALVRSAAFEPSGLDGRVGGRVRVSRPSLRESLVLTVVRLRPRELARSTWRGCAVGVFVHDPEQPLILCGETLQWMYGLTATEAALALDVSAGFTLRESAQRRGVKESTVRWHLKHVLSKTNTSSQVQLISVLSRGPATLVRANE